MLFSNQVLQGRFKALGAVDLLSAETNFNPLVPSLFSVFTAVFVVVVVVARKGQRRKQVVAQARRVYVQYGKLQRPAVIGGDEFEAILRGWLSAGQVLSVIVLQVCACMFVGACVRRSAPRQSMRIASMNESMK